MRSLTPTRARIAITDSNTAFTCVVTTASLQAVRVSISVFGAVVTAEWYPTLSGVSPTAQGSSLVIAQGGEQWGAGARQWVVG